MPSLDQPRRAMIAVPEPKPTKTQADYDALPEGAPFQLINGELVQWYATPDFPSEMTPAPSFWHQVVVMSLSAQLFAHATRNNLGTVLTAPLDVRLATTLTVQPDVLFISHERAGIITEQRVEGAPDLVAEVLSPSTAYYDLTSKRLAYAEHGMREYWVVDPKNRTVTVLANVGDGFEERQVLRTEGVAVSEVLSGLEVDLAGLFG